METSWPQADSLTFGQRLKLARARAKITQDVVGERLGVSRNTVSMWEGGKHLPETHRLADVAAAVRCPVGWLMSGDGEIESASAPNAEFVGSQARSAAKVPLVSRVPGGPDLDAADPYAAGAAEDWLAPSAPMSKYSFALRVKGSSMEPEFPDGCVIFVDPGVAWKSGDFVVVRFDHSDEATFKRIVLDEERVLLVPVNPQYPTRELTGEFTVSGVVREMRKVYR
jgi:SOS-response transcriptional repressor LexA